VTVAGPSDLPLSPFAAWHYDPRRAGDLSRVVAPPYDMIDEDSVEALRTASPYNVVRLIRPDGEGTGDAYAAAAATLAQWQDDGVLIPLAGAATFVYEHRHGDQSVRGLIATVPLDGGGARILPHEDVLPGPVADRLALLRATHANVEPILLTVDDSPALTGLTHRDEAGPPLVDVTSPDGDRHRIWVVERRERVQAAAAGLVGRDLLIADGHHRYAAARRHAADLHAAGRGPGPWDRMMALVVDQRSSPVTVGAIHRTIAGLSLGEAVECIGADAQVRWAGGTPQEVADSLADDPDRPAVALTDGRQHAIVDRPSAEVLTAYLPARQAPVWSTLDTAFVDHVLIDGLWAAKVATGSVTYHHDVDAAVRCAVRHSGTAALLPPLSHEVIARVAASGELLPHKSTSFSPKPLAGLLLRSWDPRTAHRS